MNLERLLGQDGAALIPKESNGICSGFVGEDLINKMRIVLFLKRYGVGTFRV